MNIERRRYFFIRVSDTPGQAANMGSFFRDEGVELEGFWGLGIGQGSAQMYVVPKDPDAFRNAMSGKAEWKYAEGTCFRITAPDQLGALASTLDAIRKADINLQGLDAISAGGEVACYVWPTESNADELESLLQTLAVRSE